MTSAGLISIVLGARTVEQLKSDLATEVLDAEELSALDAASAPEIGEHPYGVLGQERRSRVLAGGRGEIE